MQRYMVTNKELKLDDTDINHIINVMRMKQNDKFQIVYDNVLYTCNITNIEKRKVDYEIIKKEEIKSNKTHKVIIACSLIKEQKMDFILQKATELGVNEIVLYKSKRSIIPFEVCKEKRKMERWLKICKEASEQSKRQTIPSITIADLKMIKELDGLKLICSTVESENNLKKVLQSNQKCAKINVVVGPEGGFDPKEEQDFIKLGFIPVTLGKTILRVETVPIVFLGIVNYEFME